LSLAKLIDGGVARFSSADDVRAHADQFLARGALAVEPEIALEPLAKIEVRLTLGDTELYDGALECEVVVLQPHRAVLRMLAPPSDLVARVLERAGPEPEPEAPSPVEAPPPVIIVPSAPVIVGPSSPATKPQSSSAEQEPRSGLGVGELSLQPFREPPKSGMFSEPSFEELVPPKSAAVAEILKPRPQFNVTQNTLKFGSPDEARGALQELRDTAAFLGECLRMPTPGPATVTLDVQGRTREISSSVFPGPQGGAIIQPDSPLEALEALEAILEPPPDAVWDIVGERPLHKLTNLADFLGQPLVRQPEFAQMQTPTLPLVFRALIKHPGQFHVRFQAENGDIAGELYTDGQRAYAGLSVEGFTRVAHEAAVVAVAEHTGAIPTHLPLATSLTYVLGGALNRQLDRFTPDQLAESMTSLLSKKVGVTSRSTKLVGALGLPDPFRRAISRLERHEGDLAAYVDGATRFAWELIYILELNAALTWK
jgi:hypothetical protein